MQNTQVIKVELGVHLLALLVEKVLRLILFLLLEAGAVRSLNIAKFFLRNVKSLSCFEFVTFL